jgi:ABC-type multidrug transport system ATPase subunit
MGRCLGMEAILELQPAAVPAPQPGLGLLSVRGLSKAWGAHKVLDGVDLELPPGSLTWLGGHNGAGKTTLLRIACGLLAPDDGSVALDGLHPRRERRAFQKQLGFLSAGDRGIYARVTTRDHLRFWARLALIPGPEIDAALDRITEQLGLEQLLPMRADRMSMGQRQRLRLAMAFLHHPRVVLLDEPLNSLDETGAQALRNCAAYVTSRGGCVLWCSPGTDRDQAPFAARYWLGNGSLHREA